ncbi:hypothetical protein OXYTRIMIC_500 [Oxytricha trifallax]|uniref:Uncharacterized protein n=1 Tax=Oxytricha trifallax TaxID=1172189 RepID=A0A073HZW4_9SPIT|nr:hypothetical protein OXYTRIMIC_500 [Oxytricha trifallax]
MFECFLNDGKLDEFKEEFRSRDQVPRFTVVQIEERYAALTTEFSELNVQEQQLIASGNLLHALAVSSQSKSLMAQQNKLQFIRGQLHPHQQQ